MIIQNPLLTGSLNYNGADLSNVTSSNANSASVSLILTAVSSSNQQLSASYIALSASYNVFSGSASTRITTVSSSQQDISASLLQVSASYIALSGSYNTFSGSASTRVTQIENTYATTGSNSFRANQSITGSLVVSSTITAQTLVVQTVTSSILYSSGSNNFGNQLANTQTFTGSVNITGSTNITGNINLVSSTGFPTVGLLNRSSDTTLYMVSPSNGFTLTDSSLNTMYNATPTSHTFNISNAPKMTITSAGNVGIGTSTPNRPLEVVGNTPLRLNTQAFGGNTAIEFITNTTKFNFLVGAQYNISDAFEITPSTVVNGTTFSTPALVVKSSGNVGIGTSSPGNLLHVYSTSADDNLGHIRYENANTGTGALANAQLIGKSKYGTTQLMVWENYGIRFGMRSTTNSGQGGVYITYGTDSVGMVIQGDGRIVAGSSSGTATTSYKFRYNADGANDVMAIVVNNGTANQTSYIGFRTGTGEGTYKADIRYETGSLSLNNMSDFRFKENIVDAPSQWNKVKNSKLRIFDWKDKTTTNQLGFIAQELYQTIPEAVGKGGEEEEYDGNEKKIWTIAETKLVPTMFGALQEAMEKIEELQEKLQRNNIN